MHTSFSCATSAELRVIVPAFRAVKSLPRTIASILASTLRNLAVTIVEDGSPDETGEVADDLVRTDGRVRVIHQRNAGGYMARWRAARECKEPWMGFVDADDMVEPVMYEHLLAFAKQHNLEIAECDVFRENTPQCDPELFLTEESVREQVIRPRLVEGQGAVFVWDKIYRNRPGLGPTLKEVPILMFDDMALNFQFFDGVSRVGYLHEPLYHYDVNVGSSVKNYRPKNLFDFLTIVRFRKNFIPSRFPNVEEAMVRWIVLNARNQLFSASSAPAPSWSSRLQNVRNLLQAPEVQEAIATVQEKHYTSPELSWLLRAQRFPRLTALLLFTLKRVQALLKR